MTDEETPYHERDAIEGVLNALGDIAEKAKNQGVKDRARAAFQIMDAALLYSKAAAAFHIMSAARDYSTIAESFGDCEAGEEEADR